jgi:tetratricopeptide (TPR) repeat protein
MTLLLAHPSAEDLGRFVEGTLDDSERAAVVAHIADCDECRILIVDSAEFIEPAKKEIPHWWGAVAAALLLVAGGGYFWHASQNPLSLRPTIKAWSRLPRRPIEPRLVGFSYVELNRMRGAGDSERDLAETNLELKIADVLERRGDDPETLRAKGVAYLVAAGIAKERDEIESDRTNALTALRAAAERAPDKADKASYQIDLAAALLSTGDPKQRDLAIVYLDNVLSIDPRNPEALFNRAIALRDRDRDPKEAIAAFNRYLKVDSTSKWADEARKNLELLRPLP